MEKIYLDYAASTPVDHCVATAMHEVVKNQAGNPSSVHQFGQKLKSVIEESRYKIADSLNAKPHEVYFTSGGTESNNMALIGCALANRDKGNHIISTKVEHPSVLNTLNYLEKTGFEVSFLDIDQDGYIEPDQLYKKITEETVLVTVMYANNETGNIFPAEKVSRICREKKVIFHSDAIQIYGKKNIDINHTGFDLLSLSAHKIYGPRGIGVLYVRSGVKMDPIIHGGSQEKNIRAGTENISGIVGFAEAVEQLMVHKDERKRILFLRNEFEEVLKDTIPAVEINGKRGERLISHSNVYFPNVHADSLLMKLDMRGLACSSGSACSSGTVKPSHVLQAMGFDSNRSSNSLRFSMGRFTTEEKIKQSVKIIKECYFELERKIKNV